MDQQRQPYVRDASGVVTLTLTQPGRSVIVLDWDLLRSIDATLDEIEASAPTGFVLASSSRVFVAGANLEQIMGLSDAQLDEYLRFGQRVCGRIAQMACTTVAAINGAALGGGLELALHCDHLIAAEPSPARPGTAPKPYAVGLPEAGLSICPGWGGTNTLPARMDAAQAIIRTAQGKPLSIIEACEHGLVGPLVDPGALLSRAGDLAKAPKAQPRLSPRSIADEDLRNRIGEVLESIRSELPATQAARAVAECVQTGLLDGWPAALEAEREHLVRLRASDEAQAAIHAFFQRSAKPAVKR